MPSVEAVCHLKSFNVADKAYFLFHILPGSATDYFRESRCDSLSHRLQVIALVMRNRERGQVNVATGFLHCLDHALQQFSALNGQAISADRTGPGLSANDKTGKPCRVVLKPDLNIFGSANFSAFCRVAIRSVEASNTVPINETAVFVR